MTGYIPRYTKRIEQVRKRERALLGALKRGETSEKLEEKAEALREAKLGAVKSAKANRRPAITVSAQASAKWRAYSAEDIIDLYRDQGQE